MPQRDYMFKNTVPIPPETVYTAMGTRLATPVCQIDRCISQSTHIVEAVSSYKDRDDKHPTIDIFVCRAHSSYIFVDDLLHPKKLLNPCAYEGCRNKPKYTVTMNLYMDGSPEALNHEIGVCENHVGALTDENVLHSISLGKAKNND